MTELRFALTVRHRPAVVFGVIADMRNYHRWLPGSGTFTGVATISPGPVGLGTTYTDRGPLSTMRGEVTEYRPSESIGFRQHLRVPPLPGSFTIQAKYALRAIDLDTHLERTVSVHGEGVVTVAQPILLYSIRRESWRILRTLQRYLATLPA